MNLLNLIIENREYLKIFYGFIITLVCAVIVLKVDRLFRISMHQGIRYFRNAFFFYGLAFFTRYILGTNLLDSYVNNLYFLIIKIFLEFLLIMAGFFLLYSLLWKKIEGTSNNYSSSLLNPALLLFYAFSLIIISLDYVWDTYSVMFFSQILIFSFASLISLVNLQNAESRYQFPKFYFIAMAMSLIAWILNALAALLFNWDYLIIIVVSSINVIIFLLFLYGVLKITK